MLYAYLLLLSIMSTSLPHVADPHFMISNEEGLRAIFGEGKKPLFPLRNVALKNLVPPYTC